MHLQYNVRFIHAVVIMIISHRDCYLGCDLPDCAT